MTRFRYEIWTTGGYDPYYDKYNQGERTPHLYKICFSVKECAEALVTENSVVRDMVRLGFDPKFGRYYVLYDKMFQIKRTYNIV